MCGPLTESALSTQDGPTQQSPTILNQSSSVEPVSSLPSLSPNVQDKSDDHRDSHVTLRKRSEAECAYMPFYHIYSSEFKTLLYLSGNTSMLYNLLIPTDHILCSSANQMSGIHYFLYISALEPPTET